MEGFSTTHPSLQIELERVDNCCECGRDLTNHKAIYREIDGEYKCKWCYFEE